jgi:competence protein ComEA
MTARNTAPDHVGAELARRRLAQLGAELGSSTPVPPAVPPAGSPVGSPGPAPGDRVDGRAGVRPPAGRHVRERLSPGSRLLGRSADALPPGLQGRTGITAQHVTVVALVLAAAMVLAAWLVVRSAPQPVVPARASLRLPVPAGPAGAREVLPGAPAVAAPPASAAAPVAAPVASAAPQVVVHVTGKVRRPGVVELPAGSRVVDAVDAAGGARAGAHLGWLNLARPVVDGEQIAVGVRAPALPPPTGTIATSPSSTGVPGTTGTLVNINTADQLELEELPGVGPVTATAIIEWRTEHGGFSTVDELIEVSGIGEVTLGELRDLVTV